MKYFDLHCDTLLDCWSKQVPLAQNDLHISLDKAAKYEHYTQLLGIFSRTNLTDDEAFDTFLKVVDYWHTLSVPDNFTGILAVEGANLLGGNLARLDVLYEKGVRFLTMVWGGYTCIGGAHNDGRPYTPFGLAAVRRCFDLGIVPDMSHASDAIFWETAALAAERNKPFVCTHSNSRAVHAHSRCITDEMFGAVRDAEGLVGISMVRGHLCNHPDACGLAEIAAHIEHFLSLGGEKVVAMGGDLDGTRPLPEGIEGVADMEKIAEELLRLNYPESTVNDIFYNNAFNFAKRNGIL